MVSFHFMHEHPCSVQIREIILIVRMACELRAYAHVQGMFCANLARYSIVKYLDYRFQLKDTASIMKTPLPGSPFVPTCDTDTSNIGPSPSLGPV